MYRHPIETIESEDADNCVILSDADETMARTILAHVADKWALWIIYELEIGGQMRFSRLREKITGVSQKMLTQTLRMLETDGLVSRTMFMEVPPRVEYALTARGKEFLRCLAPAWNWIVENLNGIKQSRASYASKN